MTDRRVVITGLGAVTAAGIGAAALFDSLLAGASGVKPIELFDASAFPCTIAGQLKDFSASKFVPKTYRKAVKVMARDIEIAVAAADLAFRDSGIVTQGIGQPVNIDASRLGCNIGAGLICADLDELGALVNTALKDGKFDMQLWGRDGINNLTPLWLLKYLPNMLACHVTIIHGAKGPSNTITCGEASGHLAIGEASRTIARGASDAAIAGGAESKLNPMGLLRQGLLNRLVTKKDVAAEAACRPFDADHCGTVIGEGGGLLVLEEQSHAAARKARVYAELAGFGAGCDPQGLDYTRPAVGGLATAIAAALKDAGITAEQVDLLVTHGTAVPTEDAAEAAILRSALGARGETVPVASITGAVGNMFAGAGAVQIAVGAIALHRQVIPPTVNCHDVAADCPLNVQRQASAANLKHVLCTGCGVGGQAAAVVLRQAEH